MSIQRYIQEIEEQLQHIQQNANSSIENMGENYSLKVSENPLAAFRLIKRMAQELPYIERVVESQENDFSSKSKVRFELNSVYSVCVSF